MGGLSHPYKKVGGLKPPEPPGSLSLYYLYHLCHSSPDADIHMHGVTESEDKSHPQLHPVPQEDILHTSRDDTACQGVTASSQDDVIDPKPGLYLYV